mmetsp:Transcript_5153/g.16360  ORF Transcript_5153/g.16360 Transcript_5153/m.16360 type:complete len:133 (+) Transcript_5153:48-446(+)|eukprot:scaffold100751_cov30-Tisochrysis_lutea.AAC.1
MHWAMLVREQRICGGPQATSKPHLATQQDTKATTVEVEAQTNQFQKREQTTHTKAPSRESTSAHLSVHAVCHASFMTREACWYSSSRKARHSSSCGMALLAWLEWMVSEARRTSHGKMQRGAHQDIDITASA